MKTNDWPHIRGELAIALSAEVLQKAANYAVLMILARHLAPDLLGQFFFALTLSTFVSLFATLGVQPYLVRAVAAEPQQALRHLGEVLSLRIQSTAIAFLALNLAIFLIRPELGLLFLLTSIYSLWGDLYFVFGAFFVGLRRFGLRLATGMVGPAVLIPLVLGAVRADAEFLWIVACFGFSRAVMLAVAAPVVWRSFGKYPLAFAWSTSTRLIAASWPFLTMAAVSLIEYKIDTVMLFFIKGAEAVAGYETAFKVIEVSRLAVRPLVLVFFPVCSALAARRLWRKLEETAKRVVLAAVGVALLIAGFGIPLSGRLLELAWGSAYVAGSPLLRTLFFAVPPLFLGLVLVSVAASMHLERVTVSIMSAAMLFNVLANVVVIPGAGALGAAWTTVATETLFASALGFVLWRELRERRVHGDTGPAVSSQPADEWSSVGNVGETL